MILWFLRQFPYVRTLEAARDEKLQQQGVILELRASIEALRERAERAEDRAFRAVEKYADRLFDLQTGVAPAPQVQQQLDEMARSMEARAVPPHVVARSYANTEYLSGLFETPKEPASEAEQIQKMLDLETELLH